MKILIVYTNYGTGHQRAAEALEEEFKSKNDSLVVELLDIVTYSRPLFNKLSSTLGKLVAAKFRKFRYNLYKKYMYSKMDKSSFFVDCCVKIYWTKKLEKRLKAFSADLIISTQAAPTELVARHKDKIGNPKIANIFTDYGLHRYHLLSKKHIDYYFCPTEEIKKQLLNYGVSKEKIFITAIPVLKAFNPSLYKKEEIFIKYKLDKKIPLFLFVAGGGLGYDNSLLYFKELLKLDLPFTYIFVSGKNEKLKRKAEMIAKNSNKKGKILGYTNEMPQLLNSCNLMIGKPGGLITTECIEMNTPICAALPIPGQELKNTDFILKNNFGIYPKNIAEFKASIESFFKSKELLDNMKNAIKQYKIKNGARNTANILLKK